MLSEAHFRYIGSDVTVFGSVALGNTCFLRLAASFGNELSARSSCVAGSGLSVADSASAGEELVRCGFRFWEYESTA